MIDRAQLTQATAVVRIAIKNERPDFWRGHLDSVGHKIHTHFHNGQSVRYGAATVVYETYAWCTHEMIERLEETIVNDLGLPLQPERLSDYEVSLRPL